MLEISPIFNAMMRHKSHALLLIIQIALTLAIVANAAFIIENRLTLMNRDSGLPEAQLFKFDVFSFGKDIDLNQQMELDETMLRAIPGVIDAVTINQIPISGSGDNTIFMDRDDTPNKNNNDKNLHSKSNTPAKHVHTGVYRGDTHTLNTLGVKLIAGRNFSEDEIIYGNETQPISVAIVSKAFITTMFPELKGLEQQGVGKLIYVFRIPIKIIGIVDKLQSSQVTSSHIEQTIILPKIQTRNFYRFLIRTAANQQQAVIDKVENLMLKLYPNRVIRTPRTLTYLRDNSYADDKMMTQLLMILIVILFLITALGIVGMAVFNVNRRRKQIGTRRALGASKGNIIRYFMIENWLITNLGIVLGIALSILLSQFLMQQFSLPKLDNSYIMATMIAIWLLGIMAVYFPAKKAAQISPAIAMRSI